VLWQDFSNQFESFIILHGSTVP